MCSYYCRRYCILELNIHTAYRNGIYHRYPIQTEKSQPKDKQRMSETTFTEFLALSVDQRFVISWSASETDNWKNRTFITLYLYYFIYFISLQLTLYVCQLRCFYGASVTFVND